MSENELDARVAQLYRRVSAGLQQDRITSEWARFEVRAASDEEAMAWYATSSTPAPIVGPPCARSGSTIRGGRRCPRSRSHRSSLRVRLAISA